MILHSISLHIELIIILEIVYPVILTCGISFLIKLFNVGIWNISKLHWKYILIRLVPVRLTRNILSLNDLAFHIPTNRTDHYFKCFIPCYSSLYERFVPARPTRNVLSLNDLAFRIPSHRTEHFSRNVIHFYSRLWNILPNHVVHSVDLKHFKAAFKLYLDSLVPGNIPRRHLPILSKLLWAVFFWICADVSSTVFIAIIAIVAVLFYYWITIYSICLV